MNDQRTIIAIAVGASGLVCGVLAAALDLPGLGVAAGVAAIVSALVVVLISERAGPAGAAPPTVESTEAIEAEQLRRELDELEDALAAQVQARISAEEAVRSLGEQLAIAQRDATTKASQLGLPLAERTGDALTDAATGLFSEDYFRVAVDARIAAARRHLRPVGVVMLEVIEGLRSDTPQPAHPVMVAEMINVTLREADTACRMSDGRFALVLEDTSENGAIWTVERIRRALNEQAGNLTLRAGIACYPAHAFGAAELLTRADGALVAARDWQQDRIEVAAAD